MAEQWGAWNEVDLATVELFYDAQYINGKISSADGPNGWWEFSPPQIVLDFENPNAIEIQLDIADNVADGSTVFGWLGVYSMASVGGPDASNWWYLDGDPGLTVEGGETQLAARIHPAYEQWPNARGSGENRVLIEGSDFSVVGLRWRSAVAVEPEIPTGTAEGSMHRHEATLIQSGTVSAETTLVGHYEGSPNIANTTYTRDAWWRWTAYETGRMKVEMQNLDYGVVSYRQPMNLIYNSATLTQLASSSSGLNFFDAVKGQSYYFRLATDTASETARHVVHVSAVRPVVANDTAWRNLVDLDHNPAGVDSWVHEPRIRAVSGDRAVATWFCEDWESTGETTWKLYASIISPGDPITAGPSQVVWAGAPGQDIWWYDKDWVLEAIGDDRYLALFTTYPVDGGTYQARLVLFEVAGEAVSVLDQVAINEPWTDKPVMCAYGTGKALYACTGDGPKYPDPAYNYRIKVIDCTSGSIVIGAPSGPIGNTYEPLDMKVGSDGVGLFVTEFADYMSFTVSGDAVASLGGWQPWEGLRGSGFWGTDAMYYDEATKSITVAGEPPEGHRHMVPCIYNHDAAGNWHMTDWGDVWDDAFSSSFLGSGGRWIHPVIGPDGKTGMFAMRDQLTPKGVFYYDVFGEAIRVPCPNDGAWENFTNTYTTDCTAAETGFYAITRGEERNMVGDADWQHMRVVYFPYLTQSPEPVIVLTRPTARRRFTRSRGRW